jgi:hypothetical protein
MLIKDLRVIDIEKRVRVAATVEWEDCIRPVQKVYFETDKRFAENISCNPHAFLVGCLIPAMRYGERRIFLDAEICPYLLTNLEVAMGFIRKWSRGKRDILSIETKRLSNLPNKNSNATAGSFLSGGIDSLATLRTNRLNYPDEHPYSIKKCLFVYGFDIGASNGMQYGLFDRLTTVLSDVARDTHVELIPVYTNIKELCDESRFWIDEFHGAALAAVAHAFASGLSLVYIASTYDIRNLAPWGSHPLLDTAYGSSDLRIEHVGITLSRLAKVQLVADWDVAFQNIMVCTKPTKIAEGMLNCGTCEKCIRTMTELTAIGSLAKTNAFTENDISSRLLSTVTITSDYQASCYRDLLGLLKERGRHDLARTIKYIIARKPLYVLGIRLLDILGRVRVERIKKSDEKYLGGCLAGIKRKLMG